MCSPLVAQRTLTVRGASVTLADQNGKRTRAWKLTEVPQGRQGVTTVVESSLEAMAHDLFKQSRGRICPHQIEVTIIAPVKLVLGFNRHGFRVRFPEAHAPQPTPSREPRRVEAVGVYTDLELEEILSRIH